MANPTSTLSELHRQLLRRTGVKAHGATIAKALEWAGFARSQDGSAVRIERADRGSGRYGYGDGHRRQHVEQT